MSISDERRHVPAGYTPVTPYICPRDAATAIDWYVDVLGATESGQRYVDDDGRIGHAEIRIDGSPIMVSDAYPDYGAVAPDRGNTAATFALHVYVADADVTVAAARKAGANVQRPVEGQGHGSRMGTMIDPFGVRWMVATHVRDLSPDEQDRQAREFSGAEPGPVQ